MCSDMSQVKELAQILKKVCFQITEVATRSSRSGIFIVNFEHISHLALVFILLTLNMYLLGYFF